MTKKTSRIRERLLSVASLSGITGVFGSWQVCHSICTASIAFLALLGITIVGMPLLFLQSIALPIWAIASALFLITLALYYKNRHCLSPKMLLFNAGVLVAAVPFQQLQNIAFIFWILGGAIILLSIALYLKEKVKI